MIPTRELRYYASVPKLLLLLLVMVSFTCLGWYELANGFSVVLAWATLIVFALLALFALNGCFFMGLLRRPKLQMDGIGITHVSILTPWRRTSVLWRDVERVTILSQRYASFTSYLLVMFVRHSDQYYASNVEKYIASNVEKYIARLSSLDGGAIVAGLSWMYFIGSRAKAEQLLERIKTTFAPEISRYGVVVDEPERPL